MAERYLLINNLDGQNRRWLQQNLGDKPADIIVMDWNTHQEEWRSKKMVVTISSFPTLVERDGDSQFVVSDPIDWSDATRQVEWQKALLREPENAAIVEEVSRKKSARLLVRHCIQALQETDESHREYVLQSLGLTPLATEAQIMSKMTELGLHCEISPASLLAAVLI